MTDMTLVYGETLHDLLPALLAIGDGLSRKPDGTVTIDAAIGSAAMAPFTRALMRAEAELMVEEAATFAGPEDLLTPDQRRADALARLCLALPTAGM